MRRSSGRCAAIVVASAPVVFGLSGCRCGDEKPYTPFGVTSSLGDAETPPALSASASAVPTDAGSLVEKSVLAPPDAKRWSLGGRELVAPDGFVFNQGIPADPDGDGTGSRPSRASSRRIRRARFRRRSRAPDRAP